LLQSRCGTSEDLPNDTGYIMRFLRGSHEVMPFLGRRACHVAAPEAVVRGSCALVSTDNCVRLAVLAHSHEHEQAKETCVRHERKRERERRMDRREDGGSCWLEIEWVSGGWRTRTTLQRQESNSCTMLGSTTCRTWRGAQRCSETSPLLPPSYCRSKQPGKEC